MQLPLLCEKSGDMLLVLVGLIAGWQAGWQLDQLLNTKFSTDCTVRIFMEFNKAMLLS